MAARQTRRLGWGGVTHLRRLPLVRLTPPHYPQLGPPWTVCGHSPLALGEISLGGGAAVGGEGMGGKRHRDPPPAPQLSGGCVAHLTVVPCCFIGLGEDGKHGRKHPRRHVRQLWECWRIGLQRETDNCQLTTIKWNISIRNTTGTQLAVLYREVSLFRGGFVQSSMWLGLQTVSSLKR